MSASVVSRGLVLLRLPSRHVLHMRPPRPLSTAVMPLPDADGSSNKTYPEKISKIVDQIAQLNLLEVADLNECLKVSIVIFVIILSDSK